MSEAASRLQEIHDKIKDLTGEAKDIVRRQSKLQRRSIIWERAKSYWLAHIEMALGNDHDYLGESMFTMEDTIDELSGGEEQDEEE